MSITAIIAGFAIKLIDASGYPGVFLLMTMESMVLPVPSEAVMPFAGFHVATGRFSMAAVIIASTLGSIAGSLLSYAIGRYGGMPFVNKWGKYLLLNRHDLEITESFFKKRGPLTVLVCRFIPVVRHLISIPAGTGRMHFVTFIIYTILGAGIWNAFLTYCGLYLKQNWEVVMKYSHIVDVVVVVLLLAGLTWFIVRHVKHK
ncbi:MAG TPA: DedA family protein [Chitinivibrionales bacterium]|nr:DedA family protein [Chitinivibrionales bacterium]